MDYEKMYEDLYQLGYHGDGTNSGLKEVGYICETYEFESILDVGCSQGAAVEKYKKAFGKMAYGIDVSVQAIELAADRGLSDVCTCGNILDLPYDENSFDAIVSSDVLEHLVPEDIQQALEELGRVSSQFLFLRIAKSIEGRTDWLIALKEAHPNKYSDIANLHLSVFNSNFWVNSVEIFTDFSFLESKGKLLIFQR